MREVELSQSRGELEVVVEVERAGVCGTDMEFYSGEMAYLHTGQAAYPIRIGHEWSGVVSRCRGGGGPGLARPDGSPATPCSAAATAARCTAGRQHLCADRYEIGIRNGWPGALAEQLLVPARALQPLPDNVDAALGALVEPGGNALRAVRGAALAPGERLLVLGPGTIGLLAAQFARAQGAEVHLLGLPGPALEFARGLGFEHTWTAETLPALRWDAVIDASNARALPALALDLVEPGRPRRLHWTIRRAEPHRQPNHRAQGRHRRRRAQRLGRPRRSGRPLRLRRRGPPPTGGRHGRPRRSGRHPLRAAAPRVGPRPKTPRRPPPLRAPL